MDAMRWMDRVDEILAGGVISTSKMTVACGVRVELISIGF